MESSSSSSSANSSSSAKRSSRQQQLLAPLKVSKESRHIRKPVAPLPLVQHRQPVIIHTYSPKIIEADANNFMWLVQRLTGSSDTRLRCDSCKPASIPDEQLRIHQQQQLLQHRVLVSRRDEQENEEDEKECKPYHPPPSLLLSPASSSESAGMFSKFAVAAYSPKSPLLAAADPSSLCIPQNQQQQQQQHQHQQQQQMTMMQAEPPWTPTPAAAAAAHDFLADFASLFDPGSVVPSFDHYGLSPHSRLFGPLQSPATMACRELAFSFLKDPAAGF